VEHIQGRETRIWRLLGSSQGDLSQIRTHCVASACKCAALPARLRLVGHEFVTNRDPRGVGRQDLEAAA
jgi:hypothetical protein